MNTDRFLSYYEKKKYLLFRAFGKISIVFIMAGLCLLPIHEYGGAYVIGFTIPVVTALALMALPGVAIVATLIADSCIFMFMSCLYKPRPM